MSKKFEPRGTAGEIPVFCRYDEIVPIEKAVENPKNPKNAETSRYICPRLKLNKKNKKCRLEF